ncbi:hypothetical protein B5F53_18525 [Blautia sp. An249]|uniref:H-type lectin domain-containing protein n=1 Tax=Blautia sp. An249 TaxID=1965603 RepID=UPI000B3AFC93|nr:H-type lectin domain-containing protein [Blautia sp. An249]OUO75185.1 hypothetical protein B5F53_18525 [Blautia sp. An249]
MAKREIDLGSVIGPQGPPGEVPDLAQEKISFTKASERINIDPNETTAENLGRIMKYLADLQTVAFSGLYQDLGYKPVIIANLLSSSDSSILSASMGKKLADMVGTLSELDTEVSVDLVKAINSLVERLDTLEASRQSGISETITVSASAITTKRIDFPKAFASIPNVVACFYSGSTEVNFSKVNLSVIDIDTTGFTAKIFNGHTARFMPNIEWIAQI